MPQNQESFNAHDINVAVNLQDIKTDIRWIKEALEKQQQRDIEQIKNCTACKKEIEKRFLPLEQWNDRIKWAVGILSMLSLPLIIDWLKLRLNL